MSCIIGVVNKNKVYMACDSQYTTSTVKFYSSNDYNKVFRSGEFLIGICGSPRMISLLRFQLNVKTQLSEQSDLEYMNTTFIENVRGLFLNKGFVGSFQDGTQKGGVFLVGYRGRIYRVADDFQILSLDGNIFGVGSGSEFALPAFSALDGLAMKTKDKLRIAVLSAEKYDPYSGGDIHIEEMEF